MKHKFLTIGIDNGIYGAVVALDNSFKILDFFDTPIIKIKKNSSKMDYLPTEMCRIIRTVVNKYDKEFNLNIWIEAAHAMPQQGVSSTFKTGRGFGLWEGICIGLGLSYNIVHAKTWTKFVLKDCPAGDPKFRSIMQCQRLFPRLPLTKPKGKIASLDGRADAALIAYYGMLQLTGNREQKMENKKEKPPQIPICSQCKKPMLHCECKNNELKK